jgi:Leucine-rich repeat (LRR) protein
MKRTIISAVVAAFLLLGGATLSELKAKEWQGAPSAGGVPIDAQHFPDEQFRAYISRKIFDENLDGFFSDEERNSVTSISAYNSLAYTFPEKIRNLQGVEFFPNLSVLDCKDNLLTELNLTDNPNLTSLTCSKNQLTQLDLTGNPELRYLTCSKNQLTSITISNNNSKLKLVSCEGNQLKVSAMETFISNLPEWPDNDGMLFFWTDEVEDGNVMLIEQVAALNDKGWRVLKWVNGAPGDYKGVVPIDVQHFPDNHFRAFVSRPSIDLNEDGYLSDEERNGVTSLSVSENHEKIENMQGVEFFPNLEVLDCSNNKLSQLHLTGNPKLEVLTCSNNLLTQLDLKEIPSLKTLSCENNLLTSIDNSNNHQLMNVFCRGNQLKVPAMWTFITNLPRRPNNDGNLLFYTDEGEDGNVMSPEQVATLSNKGWTVYQWVNNAFSHYEGKKSYIYLNANFFPDAKLRNVIKTTYNLNEGSLLTDRIIERIKELNLKGEGVTDITGYQYLTNLNNLNCDGLKLTTLDVSMLPELVYLDCSNNKLPELDLSNNKKLRELKCYINTLTSLDVSMLPDLELLFCYSNSLRVLKMGSHPKLGQVQCQGNFLNAIQMGKVVDALPQRNVLGTLMVMTATINPNKTNTIYKSQVAEAVAKRWKVVNSQKVNYEGSDPVIGSGDADRSTTLEESDVQIVSDYILGDISDDFLGFDQLAADVNGDGRITIADVTIIIDKLKNQDEK